MQFVSRSGDKLVVGFDFSEFNQEAPAVLQHDGRHWRRGSLVEVPRESANRLCSCREYLAAGPAAPELDSFSDGQQGPTGPPGPPGPSGSQAAMITQLLDRLRVSTAVLRGPSLTEADVGGWFRTRDGSLVRIHVWEATGEARGVQVDKRHLVWSTQGLAAMRRSRNDDDPSYLTEYHEGSRPHLDLVERVDLGHMLAEMLSKQDLERPTQLLVLADYAEELGLDLGGWIRRAVDPAYRKDDAESPVSAATDWRTDKGDAGPG